MLKCPELKKLPKAPRYKSINFRRQTPGTAAKFIAPNFGSSHGTDTLDPTHPANQEPRRSFRNFRSDALNIAAYPMALLGPPEQVLTPYHVIDTWKERRGRFHVAQPPPDGTLSTMSPMLLNNAKDSRLPMSFLNATSKKRTSAKKSIRLKIVSKLKTSVNLIVVRGASTLESKGKRILVFNDQEVRDMSDSWILQGWSYIFFPTLEIYRMPYQDLIPLLRTGLGSIWENGMSLERKWEAQATGKSKVSNNHAGPMGERSSYQKERVMYHIQHARDPESHSPSRHSTHHD